MKYYIYEIRNKVNNKRYIGKTNNFKNRMMAHKRDSEQFSNLAIHKAIRKYGWENFDKTIIEETDFELSSSREIYYINLFNSFGGDGYNMTIGGDNPPTFHGEHHHNSRLTEIEVLDIIEKLKNSNIQMTELARQYNISIDQIKRINYGDNWNYFNLSYPIRQNFTPIESVEEIKFLLKTTSITQKKIGEMFNVGRTTITNINNGRNHFDINEEYPIRKGRHYQQK